MAEDDKILKTGDLRVKRDTSGNRYMKYVDEDERHGVRPEDQWEDVDLKVRQFFGYDTWEEYSADNQSDLTRNVQRDEDGKVVAAPTLWPFHVAYTLEEFKENLNGDKYAVVGVPKNPELQKRPGVALAIKIAQARREYFKPGGVLDRGMKNPRETLDNQELIDRAKKNLDFDSAFNAKLANKAVQHPETIQTEGETGNVLYWAENIKNYRDIAAREDMGEVFGFPVLTEPKRVDTGALQKNEEGKILLETTVSPGNVGIGVKAREKSGIVILDLSKVEGVSGLPSSGFNRYYVLEPGQTKTAESARQFAALRDMLLNADEEGNTTVSNIRLHDEDGNVDTDKALEYLKGLRFLQPTFHVGKQAEEFEAPPQVAGKGMALKRAKTLQAHHTKLRTNPLYAEKEASDEKFEKEWTWFAAEMIDPTGILSIPALVQSYNEFENNKSLSNFGFLALSTLAVLPIVGVFVKAGSRAVKGVAKVPLGEAGIQKLDETYNSFAKVIDEAPRQGRNTRQHKVYKEASKAFFGGKDVIEESLATIKNEIKKITEAAKKSSGNAQAVGKQLVDRVDTLYRQEIARATNNIKKLKGLRSKHGGSISARAAEGMDTSILRLENHINFLNSGRNTAKKTFSDLLDNGAINNMISGAGVAEEKWSEIKTFFTALKQADKAEINRILNSADEIKKLKAAGVTDEAIKAYRELADAITDSGKLRKILSAKVGAKAILKYIDDVSIAIARLARATKKGFEVQGTFDIPSVPVTEVDFLLLPSTWYQGTVLTDGEILVRERLMIKGPARTADPTGRKEEEPEVIELEPPPEEREDVIVPGEEPSDDMFMQGTTPGVATPPSTLDPDMDLTQGRGVRDKFENYPWSENNPYTAVDDDGKRREASNQARAWEAAMEKKNFDEFFKDKELPTGEDLKQGGLKWYNPRVSIADEEVKAIRKIITNRVVPTPWPGAGVIAMAIRSLEGEGYDRKSLLQKAVELKRQNKTNYEIVTDLEKESAAGAVDTDLPPAAGFTPDLPGPGEEQPEDETPEIKEKITKNESFAEEYKWHPTLFGASKFDKQLVENISIFQSKNKLNVDGEAGPRTVDKLYEQLNIKYRLSPEDLEKFKEYVSKDGDVYKALDRVLKEGDNPLEKGKLQELSKTLSPSKYKDEAHDKMSLKQFKGSKNVKIREPRLSWVHPSLLPWLKGIKDSWIVDDISLPFGGSSHPSKPEQRDYEGTQFAHDKLRFFHSSHKFGTDIDFRVPLKNGAFNSWNQNVNPDEIDAKKIINLVDSGLKKDRNLRVYFDKDLIAALKNEYEGDEAAIKKIESVFKHEDGHRDHLHFRFRRFKVPEGLKKYTWFLIDQNKNQSKELGWTPSNFGADGFDENLINKIMEFQEREKIRPIDGVAGPRTADKLPIGENKILEFLFKFTDEVENELV